MRKCPTEGMMARFVENSLNETERVQMEAHVRACPECRRVWNDLVQLERTAQAGELPEITENESAAAWGRLAAQGLSAQPAKRRPHTLTAFFRGLMEAAEAARLLLENPLLAKATRAAASTGGRQEVIEHLCALRCEAIVLAQAGIAIDEAGLLEQAISEGWFLPGKGTPLAHLGKLLTRHGLDVKRYRHAGVKDLRRALDAGYHLIVAVDAGELQANHRLARWLERLEDLVARIPDHCLIVSGVTQEAGKDYLTVTDPAAPEHQQTIPESDFLEAWEDSDFYILAARAPSTEEDMG